MNSIVNANVDSNLNQRYSEPYSPRMDIASRLDEAMRLRGYENQSALSRASGVPQPTINRILKGKTPTPDLLTVQKLCETLSIKVDWLTEGIGPHPKTGNSGQKVVLPESKGNVEVWENAEDLEPDSDRVWIDRYDYHFSAGAGLIQWEVREKRALPFNMSFFRAKGVRPKDCKLLVARGDSMEPYLSDRDIFMIDTTATNIADGERYAVYFEGEPLVKQIFKEVGGAIKLHSYNPRHPDKIIPTEKLELVQIVGRVIYRSG